MADNLKELEDDVDLALPITGVADRVRVANHNPLEKKIIGKVGRFAGLPFIATNKAVLSLSAGEMSWQGHSLNETTPFNISFSKYTQDGNDIGRVLATIMEGAIMKFKDYRGRTSTFKFITWADSDNGYTVTISGYAENSNYVYQVADSIASFFEFIGVPVSDIMLKSTEAEEVFTDTGTVAALSWSSTKKTKRWVAADNSFLTIQSVAYAGSPFSQERFTIRNETNVTDLTLGTSSIQIVHNSGSGTGIKFNLPNAFEIILYKGQQAEFAYSTTSGMFELVNTNIGFNDLQRAAGFLPEDFLLCANLQFGYQLRYKTDVWRTKNLTSYVTVTRPAAAFNEILRNGNDLILISAASSISSTNLPYVMVLTNCRIINNKLEWDKLTQGVLTGVNNRIHGTVFHNGFVFGVTRPQTAATDTYVVKFNPYDLTDIKIATNPAANNIQGMCSLKAYKDGIYTLHSYGIATNVITEQRLVRYDENLNGFTTLATYGDRAGAQPLLIYNEEIYVVRSYDNQPKRFRVDVYSLSGTLLRTGPQIDITNTQTVTSTLFIAHWMNLFNGKLFISTSGTTAVKHLCRLDSKTLALDGANSEKQFDNLITDDNTITRDGFLILHNESSSGGGLVGIHKIKYNNFLDATLVDATQSSGCIEYEWFKKEAFKDIAPDNIMQVVSGTTTLKRSDFGTNGHLFIVADSTAGVIDIYMPDALEVKGLTLNVFWKNAANKVTVHPKSGTATLLNGTTFLDCVSLKFTKVKSDGVDLWGS